MLPQDEQYSRRFASVFCLVAAYMVASFPSATYLRALTGEQIAPLADPPPQRIQA